MNTDKCQKSAVAQRTPASGSPGPSMAQQEQQANQLSQMKAILSGNLQILNDVLTSKGEKDSSPFIADLEELSKQVKDLNQNNAAQVGVEIQKLKAKMSERYEEQILLLEEMSLENPVMQLQQTALSVVQLVQQAVGPGISQKALNETIAQRLIDNELSKQELIGKVQRQKEEIAELRSNLDKANDKHRADLGRLQDKCDTLASKDADMRSSIKILQSTNKNIKKELLYKEEQLKKELLHNEEQMKKMEKKMKELEIEKDVLEDELSSVKKDVQVLKLDNQEWRDAVHQLRKENKTVNQSLSDQKSAFDKLMTMMKDQNEERRKEKKAAEKAAEINVKDNAMISLAQAATNVIHKMYEKVHPDLYQSSFLTITFDDIEYDISLENYNGSQTNMDSAWQRWDEIKRNMAKVAPNWQKTIHFLKRQRNAVAHPEVNPDEARSSLTLLREKGILNDKIYKEMGCIIEKWQTMLNHCKQNEIIETTNVPI